MAGALPAPRRARAVPTLGAALSVVALASCTGHTPPITDVWGDPLVGSVSELRPVEIGGMDQWVLARGRNASNPVLLWLHGGPGAAQMPVVPTYVRELERDFVVVHWDQRGAGKSNPRGFDESTMTLERFVRDAEEMTAFLKERFGQPKIYLLGHSWGSHLGLVLAARNPEDYQAFVGVSQHVGAAHGHPIAQDWLESRMLEAGAEDDLETLAGLGPPPYRDHEDFVRFIQLVGHYGGDLDVGMPELLWVALASPWYTLFDLPAWFRGANRGSGPMWNDPDYQRFDAFEDVPRLEVPAYFFNGAGDYNTPLAATRAYVDSLDASTGKELVVFERSAHTPFFAEPERFVQEVVRVKEETWGR